ncbi:Protein of unknown function (DUF1279) [Nesidiocoris tenuis]|uniref:DUF1279 domain-containing protein n=1 Tax=Nesidiocoris tenuis TaxID=355587 RepID=A0ABN7B8W6_9HEMI|nr:Protein of unknown function (DUF1279) [Nesidiocoris tenuis]
MVSPLSDLSKFRIILSKARSIGVSKGAATSANSRTPFRSAGGIWRAYQPRETAVASKNSKKTRPSLWEPHRYEREAIFTKSNTLYSIPDIQFAQTGRSVAIARAINWPESKNLIGLPSSLYGAEELTCRSVAADTELRIYKALQSKSELMAESLLNMAERATVQQSSQSASKSVQPEPASEQQPLAGGGGSGNQSSGGEDGVAEATPANQTMTNRQKLKLFMRDYGSTVIVFHITQSLTFLGIVYLAFSTGLDMAWIIQKLGLEGEHLNAAAGASTFVIAYTVYKFLAPLRFAITFSCTPFIVRYLRRIGFLKVK